ncbi:amino acid permease [Salisaeta longa]|uniref:amino acid permease n=1 Tax=Salisaeta longa TaxID=503170 RepID=UPI001B7FD65A|nr:amino acid permease [Salisaeta longa]
MAASAPSSSAAASDGSAASVAEIDASMKPPDETPGSGGNQFGWFGGVFTPTLLTILGVIMFLREGWVLGNAGLVGGLLIMLLGFGITICTALAMSSITTNIRIGAGGAYAIIAQSLGLEVGGSVGIPRYLSQALAVTLYIFGFREGWLYLFPEHPPLLIDVAVFLVLYGIAYVSADFAIRVQYLIMAVIAAALVSIGTAAATGSMQYGLSEIQLWGNFPGSSENGFSGTSFWIVFAVFFPATTGIMAGANMSGDLEDPKRAIPLGTMAAIGVSLVIYILLAIWLARSATPTEMVSNYTVMMDKAYWPSAVLAGLLGATFSSALASMVGAGRILQAMGAHHVVPGAGWLKQQSENGEPRNAMWVTGGIIFLSLLLRDLNLIAPLITMFFLVTYAMINAAVLIEQSLDLVSFRPRLRIPIWVSALGLAGSLFAMFIINPMVSLVAVVVTLGFYVVLARRHLDAPFEDVRSGLFVAFAEWAAKKVTELPTMQERAWKPNLLVPVEDASDLRGTFLFLQDLTHPQGSVKIVGVSAADGPARPVRSTAAAAPPAADAPDPSRAATDALNEEISALTHAFRERDIFASATVIDAGGFADSLCAGMQTLRGAFFRPNVLFLRMPATQARADDYRVVIREADREKVGTILYAPHPRAALGQRQTINVWIHDRSPDWRISMEIGNLDLALLTGYKLSQNWDAKLRLLTVVTDDAEQAKAQDFLEKLIDVGRIPNATAIAETGAFDDYIDRAPQADLNIFGLVPTLDFAFPHRMVRTTQSTCLFVRDSGLESALA